MRHIKNIGIFLLILFTTTLLTGCYSLNGSSLPPDVKTVQIDVFPNYAPLQNITLSQRFTNDLRDRFQRRTPLSVVKEKGDIILSGEITDYRESYSAVTGDQANRNRLTIRIKVNYINNKDEKKNFEKTFEDYAEYDANKTLTQVEGTLVPEITERLIDQIYNAVVTDW